VQTSVATTVGALLDGEPVAARPCRTEPITLPAGQQELLISPGAAFVVDGVQLAGPLANQLRTAATVPAQTGEWGADHREVTVEPTQASRVLVVPESVNPGWAARTGDGSLLKPVTVNGWQQGWVLPPGTAGTVSLAFTSNALYRAGLVGGLALLPLLALLAFLPVRRQRAPDEPARPWQPGQVTASIAVLAAGAVISGIAGVIVVAAALGVRYLLRRREKLCDAVTVGAAAGGLILAGAVLSQNPWRSVDGYVGHSIGVQLLALVSVGTLAASVVGVKSNAVRTPEGDRRGAAVETGVAGP
jgi:arabinofuranan 3-O-arabinosyltransferase